MDDPDTRAAVWSRARRLIGVALVALIALLAASTVPAAAAAAATTSPDPAGMTTARVKAAGISLRYPSTWVTLPLTKKAFAAGTKSLAKKNPKLAALLSGADLSSNRFFAIDPGTEATVNVQTQAGGGNPANLGQFTKIMTQIWKMAGATLLDTEKVEVGGKAAYSSHLTLPVKQPDGTTVVVQEGQLLVERGGDSTIVTVATRDTAADPTLIDTIVHSVHRL